MSDKILVRVCTGTACYVMGASDILLLEESLPPELKDRVEVTGAICLGHCRDKRNGKPPFVTINDEIMSQATLPRVQIRIQEIMGAEHKQ